MTANDEAAALLRKLDDARREAARLGFVRAAYLAEMAVRELEAELRKRDSGSERPPPRRLPDGRLV